MPTNTQQDIVPNTSYIGEQYTHRSFRMAEFRNNGFVDCSFDQADFLGATMLNCSFTKCSFNGAVLDHILARSCAFHDCSFEQVTTDYLRMYGCTVRGTSSQVPMVIRGNTFNNTFFENTVFRFVRMRGVTFASTIFKDVQFAECGICHINVLGEFSLWEEVCLTDTIFADIRLEQIVMVGVTTSGRTRTARLDIINCRTENTSFVPIKQRKCKACGVLCRDTQFYKADVCKICAQTKGYSQKNTNIVGKQTRLPAFSVEFEVQDVERTSDPDPVELVKYGFVACMDSSVQAEYKSPIFLDMVAFSRVLHVMDSCKQYVGDRCGTHIHVQMDNKRRLQNHYHEIFDELEEYVRSHTKETVQFWGRYLTSYATQGNPNNRYSWINTSSSGQPTVEFRLSKFVDARQFKHLLIFVRRLVRYLDEQLEERRTSEEYRQISKTVVNLYKKAIAESKEEGE